MQPHALSYSNTNGENIFGQPLTIFGVPVNRDIIFADHKGVAKRGVEKRQRKLIAKTTFIKFFLHHGERIHCLTTTYSPTGFVEQVLTGPAFLFFKRAILLFTDKRILHVPTRFNRTPVGTVSQIMYEDCAQLKLNGRCLAIKYKNGQQETFLYIGRPEKKKLKTFLETIKLTPKEAGQVNSQTYLCPSCTHPLDRTSKSCPVCHLDFKSDLQAKIRSLLIPGGGYFYGRYPIMGVITGLVESVLISFLIFKWSCLSQGMPVRIGLLVLLACTFILAKGIAAFHACQLIRNWVPEKSDYAMRKI
jgi:hypothetical protein